MDGNARECLPLVLSEKDPAGGPEKRPEIYERNINVKVVDNGGEKFQVIASFLDLEHSFHAEMIVDVASGRIEKAHAVMSKRPYVTYCLRALDNLRKLEGEVIGRGINRRIVELLGKTQGCVHLVEIFQAAVGFTATILIGRRSGLKDDPRLSEEENRRMWFPVLQNSCQVFRTDEPVPKS